MEFGLGLYILESVAAEDREESEQENGDFRIFFANGRETNVVTP